MRIPQKEDIIKTLSETEFAQCLSKSDIEKLDKSIKIISYSKGENIFKQGATITEIALLVQGLIKITIENPTNGLGTIVSMKKPISFFGTNILFEDTYRATATVLDTSIVVFFNRDDFRKIVESNAKCAFILLKYSSNSINNYMNHIADLGQKTIKSRLASAILNISNFSQKDIIDIPISRSDLAECSGIATGSTIRLLSDLEKEGIITLNKKEIRIKNKERLIEISQES